MKKIIVISLLACFSTILGGVASATNSEKAMTMEELLSMDIGDLLEIPVVSTATLREQSGTSAPAAINVLSGDEIKRRGYRTIKDMLEDIPGWADVSDANEIIAAVRGMYASTTNKVLVMINGHRMNDLNLGRYNLDQFLGVDIIERVEFIKGPGSVLYGNGALIGVINIITKKGSDVDGTYVDNKMRFYNGNMDYESSVTWGNKNDKLESLFNFTFLDAKGDEIKQSASLEKVPVGQTQQGGVVYYNKYPRNYSMFGSVTYDQMSLDIRREHYVRATPRAPNLSFYVYNDEPLKNEYEEDITYLDFKYTIPLSETSKFTLNPGVTWYELDELSWISSYGPNYLPPYGTVSGQSTRYEQYQFKATYENQLRSNVNLIAGIDSLFADFRDMNAVTGSTGTAPWAKTASPSGSWLLAGGFGQVVWLPIKPLELTFSGRVDTFEHFADPDFSKRFGAVYTVSEKLTTKLLYGESFLSPQWAHLNPLTAGAFSSNPDLKPETFSGWDLIFDLNLEKASFNLDFFRNHLENLITTGSAYAYVNSGENTYQGFELTGKYSPIKKLGFEGSYSYVVDEGNTSDASLLFGSIKNIPTSIYRLGLRCVPLSRLQVYLWGRAYSQVRTSDAITNENRIKSWATMDMTMNYTLKDFDFQLKLSNLFDKYYEVGGAVNRPLARPGRAVEVSVGYKF